MWSGNRRGGSELGYDRSDTIRAGKGGEGQDAQVSKELRYGKWVMRLGTTNGFEGSLEDSWGIRGTFVSGTEERRGRRGSV